MSRRAGLIAAAIAAVLVLGGAAGLVAQERFGGLSGVVSDESNAPVPGATVTITNQQNGAMKTSVTGSDGSYRVPDLEPGRYNVTVELQGFQKVQVNDVIVLLGRTFNVNAQLKVGGVSETITVQGEAEKQIDLSSVTLAHNVTAEEFDRLPKTRTFQGIAVASPGVNQGDLEGGISVNGASGAENLYTVDGVSTNSQLYGSSRQDTVFEYLQEVQVKTGGIDAEYGGALGGVISAVTKSGGNVFHGEGHYYYIGNGLSASPVQRIQLSAVDNQTIFHVQDSKPPLNQNEFGGSAGGPIVHDHLFFYGSVSPRLDRRSRDYLFNNGTDPGSISSNRTLTQAFGKLTYAGSRVQANASLLATPTRDTGILPAFNGNGTNFIVSSQTSNAGLRTQGWAIDQYNASGNLELWLGRTAYVTVKGGYFYDNYKDVGIPNTTSYTYQATSVGAPNIPANLQGPINTQNVPRQQINFFDTTTRPFVQADYSQAFRAGGSHQFKAGVGYQHAQNDVNKSYPGGYVYIYWNQSVTSTATGQTGTGTYGYYRVDDLGTKGKTGAGITSLYVQDNWSPTTRLTLNLGLRAEQEKIPTFRPDITQYALQFGFGDKLAPRLGVNYDVLGDGRMKVSSSWGRYYDWTKYDLVRGSFGGDIWHIYYRSLDTLDIGSLNLSNMPGRDLWGSATGFRDLRATSIQNTDPNTKPMYQDSFNAGWDYQVNPATTVGAHYVHNNLGRTIEDFSALIDGNNVYTIGNPGEGANTMYPASYPATPNFPMPKPKRQYDALELTVSRRFSQNWFASANYTYSRLYGNYNGLANSDEIDTPTTGVSAGTSQQQSGSIARPGSNASSAWDTDTLLFDSHGNIVEGRLATDRPHVMKLYGAYSFPTGTQVGLFFLGESGTPVTTYVNSQDLEPLMVNGRGDMGRTPFLTRTDVMVSHELKMAGNRRLRFELQVLNVFNQKTVTHIFNFLNKGAPGGSRTISADAINMSSVNLLQGYDYMALLAKTSEGLPTALDPRYGQPDLWQPGAQGQFSIKFIF